jgi:putative ABC transport system permease protein
MRTTETSRAPDLRSVWDGLVAELRLSIRGLLKNWGFAIGTATVLALAIGANVAMFSIVDKVLLQPLAYPDAERIVSVETFWSNTGRSSQDVSTPDFNDWQAQNQVFDKLAYHAGEKDVAIVVGDRAEFANDRYVSLEFFSVFGQSPAAGRLLTAEDVPADGAPPDAVVVRHGWALAHFGSAQAAIGQTIIVYDAPMRIVGVAAPGFSYPDATDLWASYRSTGTERSASDFHVVAKLKSGVDLASAQAQMRTLGDNLARQHAENRLKSVALVPLHERLTGGVQSMLLLLMGALIVVLLIACVNVSSLLLARALERAREMALRAALGASRGRLLLQLLTESCVLGVFAATVGVGLAVAFLWVLLAWLPADLPRLSEVRIDAPVILFAYGLSMVSVALFGLLPASYASRLDLSLALKQGGGKGTTSAGSQGLRSAQVIAEVAMSVVLLVSAGLLLRSFHELQQVDVGFATERVMVAYTQYPTSSAEDRLKRIDFYADVLERLRAQPGVTAAAGVSFLPMGKERRPAREYMIDGVPERLPGERPKAEFNAITPGYFDALEIPLHSGRDFSPADTREQPPVAIINQTLARATFAGESPLGKRIRPGPNAPWMEIIGVVGDTRWQDPDLAPPAVLYAASMQGVGGSLSIIARTSLPEASLTGALRGILRDADPGVPARFESMQQMFAGAIAYPRFRSQLMAAFAGVAALLAGVGIFSVLAFQVGQRTREIAVRRAVGARAVDVVRMIVGQGLRLVAFGLLLGLLGALAVAQLLGGLLYGISPLDVGAYVGALSVLALAALLATLIPAIRATAIAPSVALQQ